MISSAQQFNRDRERSRRGQLAMDAAWREAEALGLDGLEAVHHAVQRAPAFELEIHRSESAQRIGEFVMTAALAESTITREEVQHG